MTEESNIPKGFKFCECSPDCKELIPVYDKRWKRERRFKFGHHNKLRKGENAGNWKRGWYIDDDGYKRIYKPDHPFRDSNGYVREHRLVMEKREKRYLLPTEEVHHKKKVSEGGTNDIENLFLFSSKGEHTRIHKIDPTIKDRICLLCGDKTHINKRGGEEWHNYQNGYICHKCHCKIQYKKRKDTVFKNKSVLDY